jgi:hypothetical protein
VNKRALLFWSLTLAAVAVLSVFLSGVIQNSIILPLVKFLWVLKGYYGSVHQSILWGLTLVAIAVIAGACLRIGVPRLYIKRKRGEKQPGPVGQLAFWIRRAQHGPYPRWYLARTLADLALEILRRRGVNAERDGTLNGPSWEPPREIQTYLETAIHATPATFSRQLNANGISTDPDTAEIITYLESYMENSNDH